MEKQDHGKTYEKKKKSLQTIFGFHAKNAAHSTFWWNKKWGDQTHGFATPSFKEWRAYATLARARHVKHSYLFKFIGSSGGNYDSVYAS
jgi:hypothetical protein